MAAVALSTSATALTAGPAPAPAQTPQAPGAFAKLVAGAKPDGKASQDSAKPDASTDAEADAASGSEATTLTAPDGETKDSAADQPVDLLAEIEAMVAAAGQLGVSQPAPTQVIPAAPVDAGPTVEPAAIGAAAPSVATTAALTPAITLPAMAETPATPPAPVLADPASARVTPAAAPPADVALADVTPTDAAAPNPTEVTDPDTAKPAKKSGDIAALIASLKSAFQAPKGKDGVIVAATTAATPAVAIPTPQAAAPVPVNAAPIPADVPAAPESAPPAAAVAEKLSAVTTPVIAPRGEKAAAKPIATASIAPDNSLEPPTAPDGSRAPADKTSLPAEAAQPASDAPAPAPADPAPDPALAAALPAEPAAAPAGSLPSTNVPEATDSTPAAPSQAEQSITRHLDLARDNQWLDRLARDISAAATQQGHLKFQLNPEHLGALTVEIANSAAGTAIRMTADTDQARTILADAQPRLLAEVRAQGLRVAESHVDLSQQGGGSSTFAQGQQRQSSEDHKPFARTQTPTRADASDSAPHDDGELYA